MVGLFATLSSFPTSFDDDSDEILKHIYAQYTGDSAKTGDACFDAHDALVLLARSFIDDANSDTEIVMMIRVLKPGGILAAKNRSIIQSWENRFMLFDTILII